MTKVKRNVKEQWLGFRICKHACAKLIKQKQWTNTLLYYVIRWETGTDWFQTQWHTYFKKSVISPLWQHGKPSPRGSPSLWRCGSEPGWRSPCSPRLRFHQRQRSGRSNAQKSRSPPARGNILGSAKVVTNFNQYYWILKRLKWCVLGEFQFLP